MINGKCVFFNEEGEDCQDESEEEDEDQSQEEEEEYEEGEIHGIEVEEEDY